MNLDRSCITSTRKVHSYRHTPTYTYINTSYPTVFPLYLEMLMQCEEVRLSMRSVPDQSPTRCRREATCKQCCHAKLTDHAIVISLPLLCRVFFYAYRGIQGKKCGTIIVKAEELNNCRVSMDLHLLKSLCCFLVSLLFLYVFSIYFLLCLCAVFAGCLSLLVSSLLRFCFLCGRRQDSRIGGFWTERLEFWS